MNKYTPHSFSTNDSLEVFILKIEVNLLAATLQQTRAVIKGLAIGSLSKAPEHIDGYLADIDSALRKAGAEE